MKYRHALIGLCIVAPLALAAGILWRISEQQYVAMTDLGLRLRVLQESAREWQPGPENRPSWKMTWRPVMTAMQQEAKHAFANWQGYHLPVSLSERLSHFSRENIGSEADLKQVLSSLDLPDAPIEARLPLVFSENDLLSSKLAVSQFRDEFSAILSSEAAYAEWLAPILQQQQSADRSVICKILAELEAFQSFSDKLRSKCASTKNKWAACNGKDEPVTRQMKELQASLGVNLAKFRSRWPADDMENLCARS